MTIQSEMITNTFAEKSQLNWIRNNNQNILTKESSI
jgi:hypothetical protein